MGNPLTVSVYNKVESQTSTICVPCSRSISHGTRCSVNELEGTVGICIPTTEAREGPTGPVRTGPHCHTLAPGDVVPITLSDVGTISTPDIQHYSVTIAEAFRLTLPPVSVDPSESLLWRSTSPSG